MSLTCWLVVVAAAVVAAPVPKKLASDGTADLKGLHDRIADAVKKNDWADADTSNVESTVTSLLARLSKAAEVEERKLPLAFKDLERLPPAKVKGALRKAFVIGEDVRATTAANSVIVASGTVQVTSLTNCVVIAREVRCTSASNCVVIADQYARATRWGAREGECVVVAGERVRATSMEGGFVHVLRPGTGTAPADDGKREDKPIVMTSARGVRFFGPEEKLRFADKDCRWVELKAALAK